MSGDIVPLWDGSATLQYRTFPEALATVPNMSQTIPVPEKPRTLWSVIAAVFFFPTGLAAVFQSGKTYCRVAVALPGHGNPRPLRELPGLKRGELSIQCLQEARVGHRQAVRG